MLYLNSLLGFETPEQFLFSVFGLEIRYYAICIVLGILVATCLSMLLMHRKNMSTDLVLMGFIICIPSAIVGARVFACLSETGSLVTFFNFQNGGMSIMGGLIGGIGAGVIYCLYKNYNFLRVADCVLPTVPLAQAIGRWGNYFNQEVYGGVVENSNLHFFPFSVYITDSGWHNTLSGLPVDPTAGEWHYAFFFYESVANALWFVVLFTLAWFLVKKPNGLVAGLFCSFYGVLRMIMEPLRDAQFQYGGGEGVDSSMVMSYILLIAGIVCIAYALIDNYRKEGALFGSKEGNPYTCTTFYPSEKGELPLYTPINAVTKLKAEGKVKEEWLTIASDEEKEKENENE